jgi:uncharacterized protein YcbK (DUF882 family)
VTNLKYFKKSDFDCQQTGNNEMNDNFLLRLDELRERCGFPFIITSGYRDSTHTIEAKKKKPGTHTKGIAADIKYSGSAQAYVLIKMAQEMGFKGVGLAKTFIHVDDRETSPVLWLY